MLFDRNTGFISFGGLLKNRSIVGRKMLIFNILCRSDAAGY